MSDELSTATEAAADAGALAPAGPDPGHMLPRVVRAALRGLWFGIIPALLSVVSVRYLIPSTAEVGLGRFQEFLARLGAEHAIELGALFLVLYALLVRAWRFSLPGGQYLSSLPLSTVPGVAREEIVEREEAHELHSVVSRGLERDKRLGAEQRQRIVSNLGDLTRALASESVARVHEARDRLSEAASTVLVQHQKREGVSIALGIVGAALVALTLKGSVVGTYRVLSGSMLPTLKPGDHLAVNKLSYGLRSSFGEERRLPRLPGRGDVVVFSHDEGGGLEDNVKRVIGLPGDHVKMDGLFPIINGWPVPSCNVGPYAYVSAGARATGRMRVEWLDDKAYLVLFGVGAPELEREYVVGPNEVFVLGDNRSDSLDSRTYNSGFGGGADLGAIEGRVDWFLTERKNNGDVSFRRLFAHLGTDFTLEGVTVDELKSRIQACFDKRPIETHPPPPSPHAPSASLGGIPR